MSAAERARGLWARPETRWLIGITLFAAALRFSTLDLQSYAYDEVFTADRVLHPGIVDTLRTVRETESTPPLYYVLAWLWSKPFGTGEVGLRSLSALLGTALVPVVYAAGAALSTRRIGLVAALLVAVSPAFVWYSQQARSYILLALLIAAGLVFFARALEGGGGRPLACWSAASGLALASHYFAAFIVVPEALWLLLVLGRGRAAWLATAAVGAVGLALLPLAADQQSAGHADYIADLALGKRLEQVPKLFFIGPQGGYGALPAIVLAALAGAAALVLRRAEPDERRAGAIWGALTAAAIVLPLLASAAGMDFVFARNLLPAFVPATLVLAAAAGSAVAGRAGLAAAAALAAFSLACVVKTDLDPNWQRTDWRWAAEEIGPAPRLIGSPVGQRVIVVNSLGEVPLPHYMSLRPAPARVDGVTEVVYAGEQLSDQLTAVILPPQLTLAQTGSEGKLRYRRYTAAVPLDIASATLRGRDPRFYGKPIVLVDGPAAADDG
ncbi:MAG: glycosyltransferase family 39 protein [Solirubrobacterales bacterium]